MIVYKFSRSEGKLVGGHGLDERHELPFDAGELSIEDLAGRKRGGIGGERGGGKSEG